MKNLAFLKKYRRGEEKFTAVLGRLNLNYHPSKWTKPEGIIAQFEENADRDEFVVFYMREETESSDKEPQFRVYKETFEKLALQD